MSEPPDRRAGQELRDQPIAAVMTRDVYSVPSDTPLLELTSEMRRRRISCVVVCDEGRPVGIISERDIIRALSETGPDCLSRSVAETMTRNVVTCQESDTLDELMALMTTRRFRHLPVVADGDIVGIVSIGDVVKHHVAEIEMEATAMREYIANG